MTFFFIGESIFWFEINTITLYLDCCFNILVCLAKLIISTDDCSFFHWLKYIEVAGRDAGRVHDDDDGHLLPDRGPGGSQLFAPGGAGLPGGEEPAWQPQLVDPAGPEGAPAPCHGSLLGLSLCVPGTSNQ